MRSDHLFLYFMSITCKIQKNAIFIKSFLINVKITNKGLNAFQYPTFQNLDANKNISNFSLEIEL